MNTVEFILREKQHSADNAGTSAYDLSCLRACLPTCLYESEAVQNGDQANSVRGRMLRWRYRKEGGRGRSEERAGGAERWEVGMGGSVWCSDIFQLPRAYASHTVIETPGSSSIPSQPTFTASTHYH